MNDTSLSIGKIVLRKFRQSFPWANMEHDALDGWTRWMRHKDWEKRKREFFDMQHICLKIIEAMINIDDELWLTRCQMFFDCPQANENSNYSIFENYCYCIDVLTLIKWFINRETSANILMYVIDYIMYNNDKFCEFINQVRYPNLNSGASRWGIEIDTMIKNTVPKFYEKIQKDERQLLRWKI